MYVQREIEKLILENSKSFSSIGITGPRQSGKSTLVKNIFPNYKYITLDNPFDRELAEEDPEFFINNAGEYVIFDEIQYVPKLFHYLKIKIDSNREKKGLYVLTGSQQFNLMDKIGESLAGRIALFQLLPFSINEIRKVTSFERFIDLYTYTALRGSFPELIVNKEIDENIWYASYIQTYIERDVRTLYNITHIREFQSFIKILAGRCGQLLNLSEISKEIGISVTTLKRWISILEASRIIYLLQPYYKNFNKRVIKSPKIYFLDTGLVTNILKIKSKEFILLSAFSGALFENFCIGEILKFFENYGLPYQIYYFRNSNGVEIDLIIEMEFNEVWLVEFKLSQTPKKIFEKNFQKYEKYFGDKLKITKKFIIAPVDFTKKISNNTFFTNIDFLFENLQ